MRWGGTLVSFRAPFTRTGQRPNTGPAGEFFRSRRGRDHRPMKDTLTPGVTLEARHTVTAEMAPTHLPVKVLSTPSMIQMIEGTCLQAAQAHLDDGETTVGTHVCVSHSGPAAAGEEVTVSCRLDQVDRRRLTFAVEVRSPRATISEGTHQRTVVDRSRFG